MAKRKKSEASSIYVLTASDHKRLDKCVDKRPRFTYKSGNEDLDLDMNTKVAALKASPSVVSLVSFSGEVVLTQGCGTIIETDESNNNIVITSLNLIRQRTKAEFVSNTLADDLKIVVRSSDDNWYVAEICNYDCHYNLLIIEFRSETSLQPANLKMIDDNVVLDRSFQLRPHSSTAKPGDSTVVVGRYFFEPYDIMAAPGSFRMERFDPSEYDCKELLSTTCNFTRCGDGAPLVDLSGEVIGIAFYNISRASPFLPINIAYKWWNHYKAYKEQRHPSYGFECYNLYIARLSSLERILKRLPTLPNGILVNKVQSGSNAEIAGLHENDIITECDGKIVNSFFELWKCMWEKVGCVVELGVTRSDLNNNTVQRIVMQVGEAMPDELNKWRRHDYC
ncbi:hypothetical protein vseg_016937 [Gypsophila vaccaria]